MLLNIIKFADKKNHLLTAGPLLFYTAATSPSGVRVDFYLVFDSDLREVSGADFEKATVQSPQYPWRRTFRLESCTQGHVKRAHRRHMWRTATRMARRKDARTATHK